MIFAGAAGSGAPGVAPRAGRGLLSWPSVTQMLPSVSTCMPCGKMIRPEPKLLTSFPDSSNFRTGSSVEPRQVFAPQRSPTQIDVPSRSTSTALVAPHVRPSGIVKKFSTVRYGFGRSLVGWATDAMEMSAMPSRRADIMCPRSDSVWAVREPPLLRPNRALVLLRHRRQAPVEELLQPAPFIGLGCIDVPLRVDRDAVDGEPLPGLAAAVAQAGDDPHPLGQHSV